MRKVISGKRLVADFEYQPEQKLPTTQPIAQYIRQSSEGQRKKNKQSTAMQDGDMHKRLLRLGWNEDDIIPFDQDTGMSGTKRIDEREGMSQLYGLIESGKIGAVACYDPSRLFRDDTWVQSSTFVDLCHKHNIPVITWTRIFWTGKREDKDSLFVSLMTAAKDLQTFIDRTYPAKMRAIEEDHSYGGHSVPVGFILAEEEIEDGRIRKFYVPYEPHARLVCWLFARYRELGGSLSRLFHEIHISGFCFPAFEGVKKPHLKLHTDAKGDYIIKTRPGLVGILTNPAYIGTYYFSGTARADAHEAIVTRELFDYAFTRLSKTTLDGEVNEERCTRNYNSYKTARLALLENLIFCGTAKMYPMVGVGVYAARSYIEGGGNTTDLVVSIARLDMRVRAVIRRLLLALEDRRALGLRDALYTRLVKLQEAQVQNAVSLVEQLGNVDKLIRGWEMDKKSAREQENRQGLDEANRELKKLYAAREAIQAKEKQVGKEQSKIEECMSLLTVALEQWENLDFEHEQRFLHLLVDRINVSEATQHMLRIDIKLHEPFNCNVPVEMCRARGGNTAWTPDELATLKRLYKSHDRLEILQALPTRSWGSMVQQANLMHLKRDTLPDGSGIATQLTYEDAMLLRKLDQRTDKTPWAIEKEHEEWTQAHKEDFMAPDANGNRTVMLLVLRERITLLKWTLENLSPEESDSINFDNILDSSF